MLEGFGGLCLDPARTACVAPVLRQESLWQTVPPHREQIEKLLFLAEYVLRMRSADLAERRQALADLQGDVQLWRNIFKGEGTLI